MERERKKQARQRKPISLIELKWIIFGLAAWAIFGLQLYYYYFRSLPFMDTLVSQIIRIIIVFSVIEVFFRILTKKEHQLKQSEEKYRSLVENAASGIVMLDLDGLILEANEAFALMLGYNREELLGRSFSSFVSQEDLPKVKEGLKVLREKTFLKNQELKLRTSQNKEIVVERDLSLLTDTEGNSYAFTGIVRDITLRKKLKEQLEEDFIATVETLADLEELKDPYSAGHSERVRKLAEAVARKMNLDDNQVKDIRMAAALHDVGKITISESILSKPTSLSSQEMQLIREHPSSITEALNHIPGSAHVSRIIKYHHERYDGKVNTDFPGYPGELRGEKIPLGSRIIKVIDVFDTMTSVRPYRPARSRKEALEELKNGVGTRYDEKVVRTLLEILNAPDGKDDCTK